MILRIAGAAFALVLFAVVVTGVALEASGVVVVATTSGNGEPRETRIWFVERRGELVLEAGNPNNPWVLDLASNDTLTLSGAGLDGSYTFTVDGSVAAHEEIRRLMREKYGWRDVWVAMLFDTSRSALVELEPRR